jgi:plasmid stabilization system protein ParE
MTLGIVLGHQDSTQIRVAPKANTEEVPDLSLEPVRRLPEGDDGVDLETIEGQLRLDPEVLAVRDRKELVDHLKGSTAPVVDCRHVGKIVVALLRILFEPLQDGPNPHRIHEDHGLIARHHFMNRVRHLRTDAGVPQSRGAGGARRPPRRKRRSVP